MSVSMRNPSLKVDKNKFLIVDNIHNQRAFRGSGDFDDWFILVFGDPLMGYRADQILISEFAIQERITESSKTVVDTYLDSLRTKLMPGKTLQYI